MGCSRRTTLGYLDHFESVTFGPGFDAEQMPVLAVDRQRVDVGPDGERIKPGCEWLAEPGVDSDHCTARPLTAKAQARTATGLPAPPNTSSSTSPVALTRGLPADRHLLGIARRRTNTTRRFGRHGTALRGGRVPRTMPTTRAIPSTSTDQQRNDVLSSKFYPR